MIRRFSITHEFLFTSTRSRDGLIWGRTLLKLLFGARDAHPLRREAVNANGKAENLRAATQGAETKPKQACRVQRGFAASPCPHGRTAMGDMLPSSVAR